MKLFSIVYPEDRPDWHKGYWAGVLTGAGFGTAGAGMLLMSNRWDTEPISLVILGASVFGLGIIVREWSRKASR